MKRFVFCFLLITILTGIDSIVFGQQTKPNKTEKTKVVESDKKPKVPVEFYYNGKNKRTQEIVKQLTDGMRYADKIELVFKDVSMNPDHAAFVNAQVAKLPVHEQQFVDVMVVIGVLKTVEDMSAEEFLKENTILFGGRHIAVFLNQGILFKMGMGVQKPPNYTVHPVPVNPLDKINNQLLILIIMLGLVIAKLFKLYVLPAKAWKGLKNWRKNRKEFKDRVNSMNSP
jgi:hypothetical protein